MSTTDTRQMISISRKDVEDVLAHLEEIIRQTASGTAADVRAANMTASSLGLWVKYLLDEQPPTAPAPPPGTG
jgi:hypothetical protein